MSKFENVISFIKKTYPNQDKIYLHEPLFIGNEKKYVLDAIDSTFVSSVGKYVNRFEEEIAKIAGTKYAVATVNGTAALHTALIVAGVEKGDEILSQALTFIATANAISYVGAKPVFIDVDIDTMGMSPNCLLSFLETNALVKDGKCINKKTGNKISACVPMHTFGHPCKIDEIVAICNEWNISLIEDAAESLGSYFKNQHTGSFGLMGTFSFNGNKTITCGGGGAIVTNDESIAVKAKHLTTQAKIPHSWEFKHDIIGYNYRMPNLNAALACAQLEQLHSFVQNKRELAGLYEEFFKTIPYVLFKNEPKNSKSNYWLNTIAFESQSERDLFLKETNENGVMTRPVWALMSNLKMFEKCINDGLKNSILLESLLVNIPSSVRL